MRSLFISDLHLREDRPAMTALFMDFMTHQACKAEALYILGDFFNVYLGDDTLEPWHQSIIEVLQHCAKTGTALYFICGNRDFLVQSDFCQQSHMTLLPEWSPIHLGADSVLLTHGDLLCSHDRGYQRFRKIVQSKAFHTLVSLSPASLRVWVANRLRKASKHVNQSKNPLLYTPCEDTVRDSLIRHDCIKMIHGHLHQQGKHPVKDTNFERYVLGEWSDRSGSVLIYENGRFDFATVLPKGRLRQG